MIAVELKTPIHHSRSGEHYARVARAAHRTGGNLLEAGRLLMVEDALAECGHSQTRAAELLGIGTMELNSLLRRWRQSNLVAMDGGNASRSEARAFRNQAVAAGLLR